MTSGGRRGRTTCGSAGSTTSNACRTAPDRRTCCSSPGGRLSGGCVAILGCVRPSDALSRQTRSSTTRYFGRLYPLHARDLLDDDRAGQRFMLTPLRGELHTAVPAEDQSMNRFFHESHLSESPAPRAMTKLVRRARSWLPRRHPARRHVGGIGRVPSQEQGAGERQPEATRGPRGW